MKRSNVTAITLSIILSPVAVSSYAVLNNQRAPILKQEKVKAWPGKSKRFALVVGVDQYQDSQINKLLGASNDARALADALIQFASFPEDQVILLTSDQPFELQPTRANILRRLSNLRQVMPKDGLLLVSFAGHGIERNGYAYLLPADAQMSDDMSLIEDSAINVDVMRQRIRETGVAQVLVLLDACRSNPLAGRGLTVKPMTDAYLRGFNFDVKNREVTAFATFYATGVGQVAYESKEKKHGYFTWFLVEGIKGEAANEKGEVTLSGLLKYIQEKVPYRVALDLGSSRQQRPFAIVEGYMAESLVIAATRAEPYVRDTGPRSSVDLEESFWNTIKGSNDPEDFKAYLRKYPDGRYVELAKSRANPTIIKLVIKSDQGADVYVDNTYKGRITATGKDQFLQVEVVPGQHTIKAVKDGYIMSLHTRSFSMINELVELPLKPQSVSPEYTDDFRDGTESWITPATWLVRKSNILIRGADVGLLRNKYYNNFKMEFDIEFDNRKGAAWIVRARDEQNYYLFQLSGPKGDNPNTFRSYICRNGQLQRLKSDPVAEDLSHQGDSFHVIVEAQGYIIKHSIQVTNSPKAQTPEPLSTLVDQTFAGGTIGFVSKDNYDFILQFVSIVPLPLQ